MRRATFYAMITLDSNTESVGSSVYHGDRGHWFIASAMHRDSDILTRSNFACIERALRTLPAVKNWTGDEAPVQIERFSHWAVGWCDYLLVNPDCAAAVELGNKIEEDLENYPVFDEDHWSDLEMEEANDVWRDCYSVKERVAYVRKRRRQFEFHDFAEMIAVIRGQYFIGYASELLT